MANGWQRRDYPTLDLSQPIPWHLPSAELRSWNFYIHSLDMIDALLAAYDHSRDLGYLRPALRIGMDWVATHPPGATDVSPMAWYDMAVGLRAYRLAYLYQAADREGLLDDGQREALWQALDAHRAELADDGKIAFHNNHGYFQVAGQLALGRRFRDRSAGMAALHDQGGQRLRRMLDQQFATDGVHREHSPDYHRMVADTLLGLVRAGLVEDPDLLSRVDTIENALAWFVTPDGRIANFGDSDRRSMIFSADGASRKWTTPLMRAVASNGAAGSGWPNGLKAFPEGGYAVVRRPDPDAPDTITRDSYLAQTAAFHSRTHKHCDDLSIIWHERGQPLLVDAGRYGYIGKIEPGSELWQQGFWYSNPMRMFMESTRAHNTLEFDGRDALRKGAKPHGSALVQSCIRDGVHCIETRCKQHKSIWHDRLLLFRPGEWLVVFDAFSDNLKAAHDVQQWFHLAPRHEAARTDDGYDVALAEGGTLALRALLPGAAPCAVIAGQTEPQIQGWFSEQERNAVPAAALAFRRQAVAQGSFATLLALDGSAQPDIGAARVNATGRRAQLSWTDPRGHHALDITRGDTFALSYRRDLPPLGAGIAPPALAACCDTASVILEYGLGQVTRGLGGHRDKLVICVHHHADEIATLRAQLADRPGHVVLHHAPHAGGAGAQLRATAEGVWDKPWFRHPDVVVIRGADAHMILSAVLARLARPATLIWEDFAQHAERAQWQDILSGTQHGNAAVFELTPRSKNGLPK